VEPHRRESLFESRTQLTDQLGYADEEIDATAADPRIADSSIPAAPPAAHSQLIYSTKPGDHVRAGLLTVRTPQTCHSPVPGKRTSFLSLVSYLFSVLESQFREDAHLVILKPTDEEISLQAAQTHCQRGVQKKMHGARVGTGATMVGVYNICGPTTGLSPISSRRNL